MMMTNTAGFEPRRKRRQNNTARSLTICLVLGLCPVILTGCRLGFGVSSRSERDRVEARLRDNDQAIIGLEKEVASLLGELDASRLEVSALRKIISEDDVVNVSHVISPEEAHRTFRVKQIQISSLLSGGLDRDDVPGDEMLSVLLTPRDGSGEVLRTDGSIEMNVYDLSKPSKKQLIGTWSFDRETTREQWHSGVIGKGFHIEVEWKTPPSSSEVLVHCRFTSSDGRRFDTNSTVKETPEQVPAPPSDE
jgi:hypothetical protein